MVVSLRQKDHLLLLCSAYSTVHSYLYCTNPIMKYQKYKYRSLKSHASSTGEITYSLLVRLFIHTHIRDFSPPLRLCSAEVFRGAQ